MIVKSKKILVILLLILWSVAVFPLKFALITDSHIELGNKLTNDTERRFSLSTTLLSNAVKQINSDSSLEFVVLAGDIINDGRAWNLDSAKYILDNLKIPYYVVIGNNDFASPIKGSGISKTTFETAFKNNMPNFKNGVWFKKINSSVIIGIDNINPITGAEKWSQKILNQIELIFKKYPKEQKIVFTHYPISDFSFDSSPARLNSSNDFFELAKQYNVKLICSGHYHYRDFAEYDNIISFVNSALVEFPHEYLTVKLSDDNLALVGVPVIDDFTIQESETLLQKRIKRLKYIYPGKTEMSFKAKIKGKNSYFYDWKINGNE